MKQTSKRVSFRRPVIMVAFVFLCVLLLLSFFLPGSMAGNYPLLITGIAGFAVGCIPLYIYNKKVVSFLDEADTALNSMIAADTDIGFTSVYQNGPESVLSRFWEKLRRLYEQQKQQQDRILQENQSLQALVSDISHQVKTPLANIKLNLEILEKAQAIRPEDKKFIESAQTAADKLEFLLTALVKMSRLETGVITLSPQPENVYDILANVMGEVLPAAEGKNLYIYVDCPHRLTATLDKKWTAEALFNIVDNAVKYTPPGGTLTILGQQWECYTRITIQDSGAGVPEAEQPKIFSRFYRSPLVHDKPGIGIGLTLAREIITKENGYIKVESKAGKGAAFHVFLPV